MEVQDIFEDIAHPDPANDNQDPYAVCIRKLDHHFRAEENYHSSNTCLGKWCQMKGSGWMNS